MKIAGFQKFTLVDYPGKAAALIFLAGCNMRCPFCHNKDLVINPSKCKLIEEEEVLDYLKKRKKLLDGVVISGGEPTLQKDLEAFLVKIKDLGYLIKLDTNGSKPEKIQEFIYKGLVDYIAMDVKNRFLKYPITIGRTDFNLSNIDKSIAILKRGDVDYEFRTTIIDELHNDDDMKELAKMLKGAKRYYLQKFEDSDTVIKKGAFTAPSEEKMQHFIEIVKEEIPAAEIRMYL